MTLKPASELASCDGFFLGGTLIGVPNGDLHGAGLCTEQGHARSRGRGHELRDSPLAGWCLE